MLSSLFDMFVTYVLPLLGTAGAGLIVWLLRTKFKLQITEQQEKLLADILFKAVNFGEEWARKKVKGENIPPPTGEEKLKQATEFAKKEVARVGIKLKDDQIDKLLHSSLGVLRPR